MKTKEITTISLMTAVLVICSWISIPTSVPFTMQIFAVYLAIYLLGGKLATFSILVYILLGAIGVPVFAGFTGGIGILFGNTGGYIIGFLLTAIIMWIRECCFPKRRGFIFVGSILSLLVDYAFGTWWFI